MKGTYTYSCGHTAFGRPPSDYIVDCIDCYYKKKRERLATMTTDEIRTERQERANRKAERLLTWAEGHRQKSEQYSKQSDAISSIIPLGQPILIGHHSEGRHRRDLDRIHNYEKKRFEHYDIAEKYERRAQRLLAGVRIAGDAEKEYQKRRDENDKIIKIGSQVYTSLYGPGTVTKINKKTYLVKHIQGGYILKLDKSWIKLVSKNLPIQNP